MLCDGHHMIVFYKNTMQGRAQKFEKGRPQFSTSNLPPGNQVKTKKNRCSHVFRRSIYSPKLRVDQKKSLHVPQPIFQREGGAQPQRSPGYAPGMWSPMALSSSSIFTRKKTCFFVVFHFIVRLYIACLNG